MLTVPPTTKLWFAHPSCGPPWLGFDGLAVHLVRTVQLSRRPDFGGHLFVFTNRSANRVKVLYWGGHGFCLWCQRLEAGRYHFPEATAGIELTAAQFAMILDGIDLSRVRRFEAPLFSVPPQRPPRLPVRVSGVEATGMDAHHACSRCAYVCPTMPPRSRRWSVNAARSTNSRSCVPENAELQDQTGRGP